MFIFLLFPVCVGAQTDQPWKIYYDSTQLYWAKDWDKTVSLLESAEQSALTDLGLYHENYLTILNDLGTAYWKARNYPRAERLLRKSLDLKSEVYSLTDKEVILSLSNLAGFYAEQGKWKRSKTLYHQILAHDPAQIPSDIYVGAAHSLVSLYDLNQEPDSADLLLRRIVQWDVIPSNSYLAFQYKFYRAKTHRKLQEYDEAGRVLEELVDLLDGRKEAELLELYIRTLQEQGALFLETGAYSRAEVNLLKAYKLVTPDTNRGFLLTELSNNLAQVYEKLNIYDKALLYYEESLGRCRLSYEENSLPCVILQNNIAGIHLKEDNIPKAISGYQKVVAEFKKLLSPSDPLYITALSNLATAYRKNDQWNRAREYLNEAEKLLVMHGRSRDDLAAAVLNNMAVLHTARGNYEDAAAHYRDAYEIKRSIYGENSILLMDLINNLAVTYWALDRPKDAIPLFKKSIDLATRQIAYVFPNLNETEQVQFYQKLKEDFERFNTMAIQWHKEDGELLSQMFRNRAIIKSLQFFTHQRRENQISAWNDPQLNELVVRLKERRDRLGHLYQLPINHLSNTGELSALEREIDALEKNISLRCSEAFYDGPSREEVQWRALAAGLDADEALIEIVRFRKYDRQVSRKKEVFGFTDSVYYAALILTHETKRTPQLVILKDGNNLETRFYNYYKNSLKHNVKDDLSYHFFWEPLEKALRGKERIYLSADGVYHRVNVNTLRDPETSEYLLKKYDITYLLNPMQLLERKAPPAESVRSAVLMGDPVFDHDVSTPRERNMEYDHFGGLPGTQQEIRAIDKVLKAHSWKTSLYLKGAATESNLKAVQSPTILHLASHGFFSPEIVSLNREAKKEFLFHSGIVLSGANRSLSTGSTSFHNDGIVTAYEVMNLDLTHTQLVVLSACETGLGKIENGEGVFGLQRSFMQAGASNVLISLWKVDDTATCDLMIKFYEYLAMGSSMHDALKKAQTDQAEELSSPSLWGAFVLVGKK